ncbi:MAG: hypothetical protein WC881_09645, partial [Elusimicrobiota bacterium]
LNADFAEGWIELRLKSRDTSPEVLLSLAKLREEKADRIYRGEQAAASAQAEMLAAQFEANVRMWNLVQARIKTCDAASQGGLTSFAGELRAQLNVQRDRIAALLDLPSGQDPKALLDRLMSLVPADPSGAQDVAAMGEEFLSRARALQIGYVRDAIFDGGLPPAVGGEDNLMAQLRADTIARRMSYKGFTPVAAFGLFRGQNVGGLFLEAPDAQAVESGLVNVLSDALRKELQSDGRIQGLSLRLNQLMWRVADGAHTIEAQRDLVAAAETEYRAKLAQADGPAGWEQARLAQERVVAAWSGFGRALNDTKGAFVTLVSELEALGQGRKTVDRAAGSVFWTPPARPDARAELSGYMTQRMLDSDFAARLDTVLAGLAPGVTAEMRQRLADRAGAYRAASRDAEAVMIRDFTPAERIDLLTRNDKEGRRSAVEAGLGQVLAALGRLDPHSNPTWAKLLTFMREDISAQTSLRSQDRASETRIAAGMRDSYWHAVPAPFGVEGAFSRLEIRHRELGEAKQALLESYLSDLHPTPENFVLKDLVLDAYLKAQAAFDAELIKTFDSKEVRADGAMARGLDGLYDINRTITRVREGVRYGRGMAALDSLIMLGDSRLAAERWQGAAPAETDRAAAALQSLRDLRARWTSGAVELAPLYAQTRNGPDGRRLWTIDGWLTSQEVRDLAAKGVIKMRDGRMYLEDKGLEIVGGVDAAEEARERATAAELANRRVLELHAGLRKGDFVLVPDAESPAASRAARPDAAERAVQVRSYEQVFGPGGLAEKGKVLFFDAAPGPDGRHGAAHPLAALGRPLEQSVAYVYTGPGDLPPGRYPTLESLRAAQEAGDFARLVASGQGAQRMLTRAVDRGVSQLRRGWLEVKLSGFGFARDGQGRVAELYLSQDDFEAAHKALRNADRDLRTAEAELAASDKRSAAAESYAQASQAQADRLAPEYQRVQSEARVRLLEEVQAQTSRRSRETDSAYAARIQEVLARRMSEDSALRAAKRSFDPAAKAGVDAAARLREAQADVVNKTAARDAARKLAADSKQWSLYRSADLSLGLASDGRIVSVTAGPVYGGSRLHEELGKSVAARTLSGRLYAAVTDGEGRVRRAFTDRSGLDKAAQGWTMQTVTVGGAAPTGGADGRSVRSTYRLSHYVDGTVSDEAGRPLPVSLSRVLMSEQRAGAASEARHAKNWAFMPWNWGNLALELPRGIVTTPVELVTGRDPRQQHYLGRAYMYKTEGGTTEHHGFFRKVAGLVDVLDLLPDRVERYYDPSQFPSEVRLNSRIRPGESILDKRARDPQNGKDVHFGAVYAQRVAVQAVEDMAAARERTLSRFYGGAEEVLVETRRGRAGQYEQSRVRGTHGAVGLREALADMYVGRDPASDGSGREVALFAEPGNLAVARVERRVRVTAGAAQYADQAESLKGYSEGLARQAGEAKSKEAGLREGLAKSESEFAAAQALREKIAAEEDALWQKFHALAWRIAAQKALEAEIARLEAEAAAMRTELAWWGRYLKQLQSALPPGPIPPGPDPTPVPPPAPNQFWAWVLALSASAALLSLLLHWLLSKRNILLP